MTYCRLSLVANLSFTLTTIPCHVMFYLTNCEEFLDFFSPVTREAQPANVDYFASWAPSAADSDQLGDSAWQLAPDSPVGYDPKHPGYQRAMATANLDHSTYTPSRIATHADLRSGYVVFLR